jgi:hypothetical protein
MINYRYLAHAVLPTADIVTLMAAADGAPR